MTDFRAADRLIGVESGLDPVTGAPEIRLHVRGYHEDGTMTEQIEPLSMTAGAARSFAINMMLTAMDTEIQSGYVSGMRAMKLSEDVIQGALDQAEEVVQARRAVQG